MRIDCCASVSCANNFEVCNCTVCIRGIRGVGRKIQEVVRPMARQHACADHACKPLAERIS